jgi:hypothetical protein
LPGAAQNLGRFTAILGISVKADVIPGAKPFGPRTPSSLYRGR